MKILEPAPSVPVDARRGYALILVLVFTGISLLVLTGAMNWTSQTSRFTDRTIQFYNAQYAAEAATEKVMGQLVRDYKVGGETEIYNRLSTYAALVPTGQENSSLGSYQFNDARGSTGRTYVQRIVSQSYQPLESEYEGLNGFVSTYRIVSNTRLVGSDYGVIGAVQQDLQVASIPVFQFAIFYNPLLEFTWAAPLNVRGRVHSNTDIYTGSSASLDLWEDVTSSGTIQKKAWFGYSLSQMSGAIAFHKKQATNVTTMTLPIGTNNTSAAVHAVIERPPADEALTSAMGQQRYFNKAELLILVSASGVTVGVKNSFDSASNNIPFAQASYFIKTNASMTDQREGQVVTLTELDIAKFRTWAATNTTVISALGAGNPPNILYVDDARGGTVTTTTVTTNVNTYTVYSPPAPPISYTTAVVNNTDNAPPPFPTGTIAYSTTLGSRVTRQYSLPASNNGYPTYDNATYGTTRSGRWDYDPVTAWTWTTTNYVYTVTTYTTNTSTVNLGRTGVRLVNGQTLPSQGLTVATPDSLYVKGHYNCPVSADLGTTNTTHTVPASLVSDALTILSGNWNDANSSSSFTTRSASDTTVNAAVLAGIVPSAGVNGDSPESGGVVNLPRLLEDWGNGARHLTINGSLVNLYNSAQATAPFQLPGYYYYAPSRDFNFDRNFLDVTKQPPGTPELRVLIRGKWRNPPPGTVDYAGN